MLYQITRDLELERDEETAEGDERFASRIYIIVRFD